MHPMKSTGIKDIVLEEIRMLAERNRLDRVILFGSRARGDYLRNSDIDLAVFGGDVVSFALDVEEETSTLLTYDVVDLGKNIDGKLRESIEEEGMTIYEKV
ncbi:MAG: nucleotidyltransferase domain-containing protein [Lachnospiraceae bacterium]|nr:nucleotidyltransferase domain-containing protein [Lachnospiraceae bacterium]